MNIALFFYPFSQAKILSTIAMTLSQIYMKTQQPKGKTELYY